MGTKSLKSILALALVLVIVLSQINLSVAFAGSSEGIETVETQQNGEQQKNEKNNENKTQGTLGLSNIPELPPSGAPTITPFAVSNYNHFFMTATVLLLLIHELKYHPLPQQALRTLLIRL